MATATKTIWLKIKNNNNTLVNISPATNITSLFYEEKDNLTPKKVSNFIVDINVSTNNVSMFIDLQMIDDERMSSIDNISINKNIVLPYKPLISNNDIYVFDVSAENVDGNIKKFLFTKYNLSNILSNYVTVDEVNKLLEHINSSINSVAINGKLTDEDLLTLSQGGTVQFVAGKLYTINNNNGVLTSLTLLAINNSEFSPIVFDYTTANDISIGKPFKLIYINTDRLFLKDVSFDNVVIYARDKHNNEYNHMPCAAFCKLITESLDIRNNKFICTDDFIDTQITLNTLILKSKIVNNIIENVKVDNLTCYYNIENSIIKNSAFNYYNNIDDESDGNILISGSTINNSKIQSKTIKITNTELLNSSLLNEITTTIDMTIKNSKILNTTIEKIMSISNSYCYDSSLSLYDSSITNMIIDSENDNKETVITPGAWNTSNAIYTTKNLILQ